MDKQENSRPIVSVIMAVYNTPAGYLSLATDSILNQTYKNFELIIVDDGSSDENARHLLVEYGRKDSRIRVIRNRTNIGLTKSLNVALEQCTGKYIARMDSDDISMPDRLEKQVEFMENHDEICLVGANTIGFDGDRELYDESKKKHTKDYEKIQKIRFLIENVGFAHPTFMFRKDFLKKNNIKYREELKYAQDYAILTDLMLCGGKIYKIEKPLVRYREHEGQISCKSHTEQLECQSLTSCRMLRATFSTLSDDECRRISCILGKDPEYKASDYIVAINKMILENKAKNIFDYKLFKEEFMYEWYRKCMRTIRFTHSPWGIFHLFNLLCIPAVLKKKLMRYR